MKMYLLTLLLLTSCGNEKRDTTDSDTRVPPPVVKPTPKVYTTNINTDAIINWFTEQCQVYNDKGCLARLEYFDGVKHVENSVLRATCKSDNVIGCAPLGWKLNSTSRWRLEVLLDQELLEDGRQWEYREVLWHELGHALLGLEHNESYRINIMFPMLLTGAFMYSGGQLIEDCSKDTRFDWVNSMSNGVRCVDKIITEDPTEACQKQRIEVLFGKRTIYNASCAKAIRSANNRLDNTKLLNESNDTWIP